MVLARGIASVAFVLLLGACSETAFVDRITLVNPTDYPAHVEVSDGSKEHWLALTTIRSGRTTRVEEVIDQGATWVFRFAYAGKQVEEIEMSRRDLAQAEWRVEVPPTFDDALREQGLEPPP